MQLPSSLLALASLAPLAAAQGPALDRSPALLRARAETPAEVGPQQVAGSTGTLLFSWVGGDNAECVRAIRDVNGDGRDEVVVGIGESGTDNVFCLDGASSGTGSVLWSYETADGASGGSVYGDQAIVPASDIDGNGRPNVLLGTAWGGRTAYDLDAAPASVVWKLDTYTQAESGWVYSLCELSDVNGDGVRDHAFGTGSMNDAVYCVSGASPGPQATVLWRYAAGDVVYSVRNLGDVNGDGSDDVLAAVGDGVDRIVCLEGDSASPAGNVLWSYTPGVSVYSCAVLSDVNGDGVDEALAVCWTLSGNVIRCLDGATGVPLWGSGFAVTEYGMQAHEIGDVTGDGRPDVVVASWENAAIVLDGMTGALVWRTTVGTTNGGDVWTARPIEDLNGDGRPDVIAGSFDYHVYALDGVTGAILWTFDTGNRVFSVYPIGDLDGDGVKDVVAGTQDTTSSTVVYVLSGAAGGSVGTRLCFGVGCPCGNDDPSAGCANSTGVGGSLDAAGTASVAADDLLLLATQLSTNDQGLYYMGDTVVSNPLYDGLQCALGTTFRFLADVQNSGPAGTMTLGPGVVAKAGGLIVPGTTWYFHAWHRDTGGPCGTGANLTNLVGVSFGP